MSQRRMVRHRSLPERLEQRKLVEDHICDLTGRQIKITTSC
jgi:hypothetical protein